MAYIIPNRKQEQEPFTPTMVGPHKIKAQYECVVKDIDGNDVSCVLEDEVDIYIKAPNLRSTEEDGRHLFFFTSDEYFLNVTG